MSYTKFQQALATKIDNNSTANTWEDWKWQLKNSIKDIDTFERLTNIKFADEQRQKLNKVVEKFPLSITPYYLSLIKNKNLEYDPIFKQSFPSENELVTLDCDMKDPLEEDLDSPVPLITHRYPDRVLFYISGVCSMYCRHCTRKRKVGDVDYIPDKETILNAINYIRQYPSIRDVLLSGGDPFLLNDDYLDWILTELKNINHVEIIRIGTRTPVVLPYRITNDLVSMLQKHHPIWINTHFNHPRELTSSAREAIRKLADGGFPLGNQSVLLADVNDCPRIIKKLIHELVKNRVRPYYMYQCDLSEGLSHFRTPIGKGIEIIESLVGHTTGMAVPTYVVDAPGGGGKIPIMPNYIVSWSTNKVILRNYEGIITSYREPDNYNNICCDLKCKECTLELDTDPAEEVIAIGLEKLLSEHDSTISLTPENNERFHRRKEYD
ncbi:MAG: lysine 2,3-aminomutase [Cyanobacteriota bacterium]